MPILGAVRYFVGSQEIADVVRAQLQPSASDVDEGVGPRALVAEGRGELERLVATSPMIELTPEQVVT